MTTLDEGRAQLSSASINNLPDSAFAYIESGGTKDSEGKTVPRSKRHFPVHDAAHARNALARAPQSPFGKQAMPKILAAAHKFGIDTSSRARDVTGDMLPDDKAEALPDGTYRITNVEELQSTIAELASNPGIHQNANQGALHVIIEHLKARARALDALSLIPPAWFPVGTVIVPRSAGEFEERSFAIAVPELRDNGNGTCTIAGYASTFNDPYPVIDKWGEFTETILSGAWARSIANRASKIHLLVAHGGIPLASTRAGTLRVHEDSRGLPYEGDLYPEKSPLHADVAYAVGSGAMDENSVGFRVPSGGDLWSSRNDERTISEAVLVEISVLPRGANPNTEAFIRNEEILAEIRRLEDTLRVRHGMTADEARRRLDASAEPSELTAKRRMLLDALNKF